MKPVSRVVQVICFILFALSFFLSPACKTAKVADKAAKAKIITHHQQKDDSVKKKGKKAAKKKTRSSKKTGVRKPAKKGSSRKNRTTKSSRKKYSSKRKRSRVSKPLTTNQLLAEMIRRQKKQRADIDALKKDLSYLKRLIYYRPKSSTLRKKSRTPVSRQPKARAPRPQSKKKAYLSKDKLRELLRRMQTPAPKKKQ